MTDSETDRALAGAAAPAQPALRGVLASLALGMLLPSLATSIANVALPTLAVAFDAPFQQLQWVVLAYLLATTTLIVSVGRLGDLIGRRRLLLAGIALFTAASALCGLAPGLGLLIAARAAQGLGAAVMLALTMALVAEVVPKARTGAAMGLAGSLSAAGTALGPTLGGVLIAGFGWPAIFFINLPLGLLSGMLVWRFLPADAARPVAAGRPGFDKLGTLLLALTLAAYALALTVGRGHFGALNLVLLVATALGVGLFAWAQARAKSPLIRLAMLRDPVLSAGLATSALVSAVMMATLVVGPFYLARGLGLASAQVGLVMSVGPVIAALAGVPAGRLVDHFGAPGMAAAGLAGMLIGCVALCIAAPTLAIAGYLMPLAIITASYALFQAANNSAVMTDVAADQRGVVSGLLNLARNLGLITGASVLGAVFVFASGAVDITAAQPESVARGMRLSFAVAAALLVGALLIVGASPLRPRPALRPET